MSSGKKGSINEGSAEERSADIYDSIIWGRLRLLSWVFDSLLRVVGGLFSE